MTSRSSKRRKRLDPADDRSPVPALAATASPPSYAEIAAAIESEPLSCQVRRYKEWRRNGSAHDQHCAVCPRNGKLEPCHTCRLSFHVSCMPRGWVRDSFNQWFCPVCVNNSWHVSPPALTPPPSPELLPPEPVTTTDLESAPEPMPPAAPENGAHGVELEGHASGQTLPTGSLRSDAIEHTSCERPGDARTLDSRLQSNTQDRHISADHQPPTLTGRHRKSRYSTLPSEVDASLSVLYREVEAASALRTQVEELQAVNTKYRQMIQLRDQSLFSLRRENDSQQRLLQDLGDVQAKIAALESDLAASREEAARATELVNDWKGKLAQLLDN